MPDDAAGRNGAILGATKAGLCSRQVLEVKSCQSRPLVGVGAIHVVRLHSKDRAADPGA